MTTQPITILQAIDRGIRKLTLATPTAFSHPLDHIVVGRTAEGAPSQRVVAHSPRNFMETGRNGGLESTYETYRGKGAVWIAYIGPSADSDEYRNATLEFNLAVRQTAQ